eukprot:TRINITY_DN5308_c0_g1_i1.p1 TRINITY_DN5308_c0_g1~~TRINITY_DN5308_c0_g1_i1.p1  ORF type:complete len:191 (+),score=34.47 TRINITY_DN5308_c0_g1_i1:43-615(+)
MLPRHAADLNTSGRTTTLLDREWEACVNLLWRDLCDVDEGIFALAEHSDASHASWMDPSASVTDLLAGIDVAVSMLAQQVQEISSITHTNEHHEASRQVHIRSEDSHAEATFLSAKSESASTNKIASVRRSNSPSATVGLHESLITSATQHQPPLDVGMNAKPKANAPLQSQGFQVVSSLELKYRSKSRK